MKYKILKISFVMFLLFINTVFAQTIIYENSKEYTSRSYQEDVNKVLDVKLEQYETVYVYKFVNTQNGNSNMRIDKRRISDYHWFSYDELDEQKIHKNIRNTGRLAIKIAENYE